MDNTSENQSVVQAPQSRKSMLTGLLVLLLLLTLALSGAMAYKTSKMSRQMYELKKLTVELGSDSSANLTGETVEMDKSSWNTYQNSEFGFMFKYPSEWMNTTADEMVESGNREFTLTTHRGEVIVGTILDSDTPSDIESSGVKVMNLSNGQSVMISYLTCVGPECGMGETDMELFQEVLSTFSLTN